MDQKDSKVNVDAQSTGSEAAQADAVRVEPRRYAWLGALSFIACVASWFVATVDGYVTIAVAAVSIFLGAFALGSKRGAVRNTAITAIIASSVLIIVVGAFMLVLYKLIG